VEVQEVCAYELVAILGLVGGMNELTIKDKLRLIWQQTFALVGIGCFTSNAYCLYM
jgi:hypothetical protein